MKLKNYKERIDNIPSEIRENVRNMMDKLEKENLYITVMFPYPSSDSLHVGHYYNYAIVDSYCRYKRYIGHNVYQPFGYDAFGIPNANYAKKVGRDAKDVTYENIDKFRIQMNNMNTEFEEVLNTCDPSYYKWTQWLFLKLKEHGLAYKKDGDVNWCTSCETVLANEQVKDNKCERCSTTIEIRQMNQWYFKITEYKDKLIKNLDWIDYPESTINAQRNWLENLHDWCVSRQRSWGCPIPVEGEEGNSLDTFVCSSFYTIRYCDPYNEEELCSKEKYKQVDLYVGGREHATSHLIYARFIHMFLYEHGYCGVNTPEPFAKLVHQGVILKDNQKMSKSKGNVVSPDLYDSDELRMYLSFLGPYTDGGSWSDQNIKGITKFINRFKEWMSREGDEEVDVETFKETIFNYSEAFKFNKVISEWMILINKNRTKNLTSEIKEELISLFEIYAPGIRSKLS